MKPLVFLGLLALSWASSIKTTFPEVPDPQIHSEDDQHKYQAILQLFQHVYQPDYYPEHQTIGESYSFEDNIKSYTNPQYVYDFFKQHLKGGLPKGEVFSIFYDKHQKEAIGFFRVLYSAIDFETFYKTAVWGRLHLNEGLYIYSLSVALVHRPDTWYMQLPPIYEIYPYYFYNFNVFKTAYEQTGYHFGHYQNLRPQFAQSYPYGSFQKSYKYPYYFGQYFQGQPYQQEQEMYQNYPYSYEKYQQFPQYAYGPYSEEYTQKYGKVFQSYKHPYGIDQPKHYQQGYNQEVPHSYLHFIKSKQYPTGKPKYPFGHQQGYYQKYYGQEVPQGYQRYSYEKYQPSPEYGYGPYPEEYIPKYLKYYPEENPSGYQQGYYQKYYGQKVPQHYQKYLYNYEKNQQIPEYGSGPYSHEYYQKYSKNFPYQQENPSEYQQGYYQKYYGQETPQGYQKFPYGYEKNQQFPPSYSYGPYSEQYYQKQGKYYQTYQHPYPEEIVQNKPFLGYGPYSQLTVSKQYPYHQKHGPYQPYAHHHEDHLEHPWNYPQVYKKIQKEPFFSMIKQFGKPIHSKYHGQEYPYIQKSFQKSYQQAPESFYGKYPTQYESFQKSPYHGLYQEEREKVPLEYYQQGVTIDANYSVHYAKYNPEYLLSYFTEDVGLNAYYYYYHIYFPFWMKNEEICFNTQKRGEQFYYVYQQLLARYNLERISNGLGEMPLLKYPECFDDIPNGFQTDLMYPNGAPFPYRPDYVPIKNVYKNEPAYYDNDTMSLLNFVLYEKRLLDAIDSGFVLSREGKHYSIFEPQGFEILGNLIQCNPESPNVRYYGPILVFARYILGYSNYPLDQYHIAPSVLEQYETSLRDPAFYQLYGKIVYYFQRYKQYLPMYSQEELLWDGVKIQDVTVDKLVTYFDYFYSDISHVAYSKDKVEEVPVHIRQYRLNHKPFNYYLNVLSQKSYDAVVRVFLGPKYDVYGEPVDINRARLNFVEIDKFHYSLILGLNTIQRNSKEFYGYVPDRTSYKELFMQIVSSQQTIKMTPKIEWGFPHRLLLPKGTKEGQAYQMYFLITPHQPDESIVSNSYTGNKPFLHWDQHYDQLPYGYPFDKPIDESVFYVPNSYFHDVVIYNEFTPEYIEEIPLVPYYGY